MALKKILGIRCLVKQAPGTYEGSGIDGGPGIDEGHTYVHRSFSDQGCV